MSHLLADQTYQTLRQQIIAGIYRPSQRLVESDLAQSLGVSRISVRSALQRLHQEGLVTLQPHRGASVTDITLEQALQIMEVRQGLEGWAGALAARRITDDEAEELARIAALMEEMLDLGRHLEYSEANALFHQRIISAARNARLQQSIDSLQTSLVRYRFRAIMVPNRGAGSRREHSQILEAIRARSPERAEAAMREHIESVAKAMVDARRFMEF